MELVEPVELTAHLQLLVPAKYFLPLPMRRSCNGTKGGRNHQTIGRTAKFDCDRDDLILIIWNCIERLARSPEHEFLSQCGYTHTP